MTENEVFSFLANAIPSVWALEVLLLLKRHAPEGRRAEELVAQLRSSATAVQDALTRLSAAGLVVEDGGVHVYRPASAQLELLVCEAEKIYRLKPSTMIKIIVTANNENLRIFANSFKLKD